MERENDIIQDSYYLINLFHKDNKVITQLHVQKLMFLFEAYYMNVTNENKLYDCGYKAWNFGPVAPRLYKRYKNYGKDDIQLSKEDEEIDSFIMDAVFEVVRTWTNINVISQ